MKVLVTGATGFTGTALLKRLVSQGATVRAIARSSSNLKPFEGMPIEWIRGDVYDPITVTQAMVGIEYVFHIAAAYREAKISDDIYAKVHVESTKLLVREAIRQPAFQRFVHVSTMGVHGHVENPPGNENSPYSPGDLYQETKLEAELWIRKFSETNGLPLSVIRPCAIYGPGDKRLLKLFKMAKRPLVPILGYTKGLYHLIHVEDLVEYMLEAAISPKALGEVFLCGNPEPMRLVDLITTIGNELGKSPKFVRIPAAPFFALGYLCEKTFPLFNLEPPIYRRRVAFFTKDRSFDTSKLINTLGSKFKYSNQSGLAATARWYLDKGWL